MFISFIQLTDSLLVDNDKCCTSTIEVAAECPQREHSPFVFSISDTSHSIPGLGLMPRYLHYTTTHTLASITALPFTFLLSVCRDFSPSDRQTHAEETNRKE